MESGQMERTCEIVVLQVEWTPWSTIHSVLDLTLLCRFQSIATDLEWRYMRACKRNKQEKEAIELAADAINAGIFNDLGSGGCPNVRIIRQDGSTEMIYEYRKQNKVEEFRRQYQRPRNLDLPRGTAGKIEFCNAD